MLREFTSRYADLLLSLSVSGVLVFAIGSGYDIGPLRILLGVVAILFVPGYLFRLVLFPSWWIREDTNQLETVVSAFVGSIVLLIITGLALDQTPWGVTALPIVVTITIISVVLAVTVALKRRRHVGEEAGLGSAGLRSRLAGWSRIELTGGIATVGLVLVLLVVLSSPGVPQSDTQVGFTEMGLYTTGADGERVADDYPTDLQLNDPAPLVVVVTNQEGEPQPYTLVVTLERLDRSTMTVLEEERLNRWELQVEQGEERVVQHELTPTIVGEQLRLQYQLYRGQPQGDPYRETHLWVNVSR
jgi:uncharacterized membrane protein